MNLRSYIPDRLSYSAKLFLMVSIINGVANGVFGVIIQIYISMDKKPDFLLYYK